MAEIIPFEPDTDNAGVGSGDNQNHQSHILCRQKGMALRV